MSKKNRPQFTSYRAVMAPVSYMKIMKASHNRINAYFLDTAHEEKTQKTLTQSTDRTLTISGEWRRRNYGWAFFF